MATRIVSLVPSQTELLFDLGLDEEVVGITKFCVHPTEWFQAKTRVGGTKTINIDKIKALNPDLIIANKEENVKEQVEALSAFAPVYVSDINDLNSALKMIDEVGGLVDRENKSEAIINKIRAGFNELTDRPINKSMDQLRAAYFIWKDPYMVAGGDTFISDMLERCGLKNIFSDLTRYPEINIQQLEGKCDLLLLSSEPYPFKQKHINELQLQLRGTKIILVDGEMFSWYGSRLLYAAEYFQHLIQNIHQQN